MSASCQVLVIGGNGQLASELSRTKWPGGWRVDCLGRASLDLRSPEQAAAQVAKLAPNLVVNAAAYTDVERAESEAGLAMTVNATGPAAVATVCDRIGAPFVTVSSDYVFDGSKATAYVEDDPISPVSAYGRSKAEGEALVRAATVRHVILRTSWLFSPFGANFVKTMRRLRSERPLVRVVADQRGCPTACADLSQAIVAVCSALAAGQQRFGTFHVSNTGPASWYDFATAVFEGLGTRGEPSDARLEPITTAEFPTKARRPANSVLDNSRFERAFGMVMRPWPAALADCLDELVEPAAQRTTKD